MLHSLHRHSLILLIILSAIVLSSVSVAMPTSFLTSNSTPIHSSQRNIHTNSQHHTYPCASMGKTGLVADFPCSGFTQHNDDHCASCAPIYATLPATIHLTSHQSTPIKYTKHKELITDTILTKISRPPIQSVYFQILNQTF